jgi:hypothetical protein
MGAAAAAKATGNRDLGSIPNLSRAVNSHLAGTLYVGEKNFARWPGLARPIPHTDPPCTFPRSDKQIRPSLKI